MVSSCLFSERYHHHARFPRSRPRLHTPTRYVPDGKSSQGNVDQVPALVRRHSGLHTGEGMKSCVRQMAFQVLLTRMSLQLLFKGKVDLSSWVLIGFFSLFQLFSKILSSNSLLGRTFALLCLLLVLLWAHLFSNKESYHPETKRNAFLLLPHTQPLEQSCYSVRVIPASEELLPSVSSTHL